MLILIIRGRPREAEIELQGRGIDFSKTLLFDSRSTTTMAAVQIQFNSPQVFLLLKRWFMDESHQQMDGELLYYGADPR
jgi:hypothetical protein